MICIVCRSSIIFSRIRIVEFVFETLDGDVNVAGNVNDEFDREEHVDVEFVRAALGEPFLEKIVILDEFDVFARLGDFFGFLRR